VILLDDSWRSQAAASRAGVLFHKIDRSTGLTEQDFVAVVAKLAHGG
jgi:hypothetical protein